MRDRIGISEIFGGEYFLIGLAWDTPARLEFHFGHRYLWIDFSRKEK